MAIDTIYINFMSLVEKPKMVQVHYILDLEGLRDQSHVNDLRGVLLHDNKSTLFHGLPDIMLGPSKQLGITHKHDSRQLI